MLGAPPALEVLSAFGAPAGRLRAQRGGQGSAWRAGHVFFKAVDDEVEAHWTAELLSRLPQDGFRISRPIRSTDERFVVDGWSAWEVITGSHDTVGRWREVMTTGRALNGALAATARPDFLDTRTNVWSVGDRCAWDEQPFEVYDPTLAAVAHELRALVRPSYERSQLIHGDLSGNVLFSEGLAPAVIDFTPYWRPAVFALAIVAVDAVCWHGATGQLFDGVADTSDPVGVVARAGLYRLVTSDRAALAMPEADSRAYLAQNRLAYLGLLATLNDWCC